MSEPRRIVLILGNGFDLDLGLKTSYKDFWESKYCPKDYPAPLIHHLNQRWKDDLEDVKWYDLENELLNYYNNIPDPKVGADFLTEEERSFLKEFTAYGHACGWYNDRLDLVKSLVDKGVLYYDGNPFGHVGEHHKEDALQSPIWRDRKALQLIKDGLCNYLKSVEKQIPKSLTAASNVLLAMLKTIETGDFVDIYTFNYTHVKLGGNVMDKIPVHHMHGNCTDGRIVVGTRDELEMSANYDFLQKGMDDNFLPPDLVTALKEADEVIIFGHSLGANDRQYFAPFFKRQASEDNPVKKDITIFTRDLASQREIKRALQQMTDGKLSSLFSINQPIIIKTNNLNEDKNAFIGFLVKHNIESLHAESILGNLLID